jgi:hypothetical protein
MSRVDSKVKKRERALKQLEKPQRTELQRRQTKLQQHSVVEGQQDTYMAEKAEE